MMDYVKASRDALAEVLLAAGPLAGTLCDGWQTRHLAAHLVLREHSLWAAGLLGGPLGGGLERRLTMLAERGADQASYAAMISRFRSGPQGLNPFRLPALANGANILEYFVHTEDVRRARTRWAPRSLDRGYAQLMWRHLVQRAGLLYRGAGVGVILIRPDGVRHRARKGESSVAISGGIGELVLHAHGRGDHALVSFEGEAEAISTLRSHRPSP